MKKKNYYAFVFFSLFTFSLNGQSALSGIVFSTSKGVVYPQTEIQLFRNSEIIQITSSNTLGLFRFDVTPGDYSILINEELVDSKEKIKVNVLENVQHFIEINLKEKMTGHPHLPVPKVIKRFDNE